MSGFTDGEAFLNALAKNTFLTFWSWPNLFRDQGDCCRGGVGKEICDLIVIFGNDIILFSDKRIGFSRDKESSVAWSRWARKAIASSHKQLLGAERWLRDYPDRIFLDQHCQSKLPLNLPDLRNARFHKIVVCHGMEDDLQKISDEGSLIFDGTLTEKDGWMNGKASPFIVGRLAPERFVHILTQSSAELILSEFDAIKDFLWYLRERTKLLTSPDLHRIRAESDIVQMYYEGSENASGGRSIDPSIKRRNPAGFIDMGGMERLHLNPSLQSKKCADKIGCFWDQLIEAFAYHVLNGTSEHKKHWDFPHEVEPTLRLLAQSSRFERRVLADAFLSFYKMTEPGIRGTRVIMNPEDSDVGYLFLLLPHVKCFATEVEYRETRCRMLEDYCLMAKLKLPSIKSIIGIGAKTRENGEAINNRFFSEGQDFLWCDLSEWTEVDRKNAEQLEASYKSGGMLGEKKWSAGRLFEFPNESGAMAEVRPLGGIRGAERNKPCWCGSGLKVKKCCGR